MNEIGNVTFIGNRRNIGAVYAGLDVVALTSLNEGTPLSLIEAMASRRPVISTLVGGVVNLLGDATEAHPGFAVHERGIGVEPGNRGELSVWVDGKKVAEKSSRGFPADADLIQAVSTALQPASP